MQLLLSRLALTREGKLPLLNWKDKAKPQCEVNYLLGNRSMYEVTAPVALEVSEALLLRGEISCITNYH